MATTSHLHVRPPSPEALGYLFGGGKTEDLVELRSGLRSQAFQHRDELRTGQQLHRALVVAAPTAGLSFQ